MAAFFQVSPKSAASLQDVFPVIFYRFVTDLISAMAFDACPGWLSKSLTVYPPLKNTMAQERPIRPLKEKTIEA